MRFIMTFVWAFLLVTVVNYLASSIKAVDFVLEAGYVPAVALAILVFVLAAVIPNESTPDY